MAVNWKITIKTCVARSEGTVYAYAEAQWDGTAFREVVIRRSSTGPSYRCRSSNPATAPTPW
ncbi:hypothetical protein [Streptomyces sp. A1547]|uniref:hypothetical protein n=1 Tax=Streptomyces sp. A1547 TaxID=2563105 RepID=UPI00109E3807|nr:hypothetical protein [Streptomyces sp. A1547]THA28040.1 hypothetical protein E6W17_41545 [Streptomyces sp. A1547]